MTKEAELQKFFSSFGLQAYEENNVPSRADPDAPDFPYLTFSVSTGAFGDEMPIPFSLWYRGTSWAEANRKKDEISRAIGAGGKILPCDGGAIWIKRGAPFAQNMSDPADDLIKRKYINITVEYFTTD